VTSIRPRAPASKDKKSERRRNKRGGRIRLKRVSHGRVGTAKGSAILVMGTTVRQAENNGMYFKTRGEMPKEDGGAGTGLLSMREVFGDGFPEGGDRGGATNHAKTGPTKNERAPRARFRSQAARPLRGKMPKRK